MVSKYKFFYYNFFLFYDTGVGKYSGLSLQLDPISHLGGPGG